MATLSIPAPACRAALFPTGDGTSTTEKGVTEIAFFEDLQLLWAETLGDPEVIIAILDGPVDRSHPSLKGAKLRQLESLVPADADDGPACQHGTHVASVIFGQHNGPVRGVAPGCRGLIIPIFESVPGDGFRSCSQLTLAYALSLAVQYGAQIINISGGQFVPSGEAHPLLANVVRECIQSGVLIVAAVGNDGCACPHVPAAMDSVLAVGAMDGRGEPLAFSNWGGKYQVQGVLALGENILGAQPGGGTIRRSGTSYATAVVSGIAGLLLSQVRKRGRQVKSSLIRQAILRSAWGCDQQPITDCRRLLAGRLNVKGALSLIHQEIRTMSEVVEPQAVEALAKPGNGALPGASDGLLAPAAPPESQSEKPGLVASAEVQPSACTCAGAGGTSQLVYALGQLGYDLISEARRDSLRQTMAAQAKDLRPDDPVGMLAYLEKNPHEAAAIEWTLNVDGTPVYAVRPQGPFAAETYQVLRRCLREQLEEGAERVSVPGVIGGKTTLFLGQVVPVVIPEQRGIFSWTIKALVDRLDEPKKAGVQDFLERVYHQLRNLGMLPQERALNFAATNAYQVEQVYESALKGEETMELDTINVGRSPICRPGSDCWDVEVYLFYPHRPVQTVRRVYRFTVDVSDLVPVTVGPMRSWFTR
jgi:hypothetical protein